MTVKKEKIMGKYIGIDLGTTFSVVAYIDADGKPEIINNQEGDRITASAVLFEDDHTIVGKDAKKESVLNPEHFVGFAKRNMGNNCVRYNIDGRAYRPEEISGIILEKIKRDAETALGEEILGAVITVPAYFTEAQRVATRSAAEIANLPLLGSINEPTAAALAYGISKGGEKKQNVLVYDLGGGTFDVSIMQFGENKIEILSSMGNAELGGYDFDMQLVDWFTREALTEGVDVNQDPEAKQELLMNAEEAKKTLSSGRSKTRITVAVNGKKVQRELTREEFENMIEPFLYQTIALMDAAMEEAGLSYSNLDKILLVGGSTRIPLVKAMIEEETGHIPSQEINPDEAVAIGASYYAVECVKNGAEKKEQSRNFVCEKVRVYDENAVPELKELYTFVDRTAHGIGVVIQNDRGEDENSVILPKNSVIPTEVSQDYCTLADYQEQILLKITQGEQTELKYTTIVGEAELNLRPKPKGAVIRVIIGYDEDAIIHVQVIDLQDDENLGEMRIARVSNMSDQEIEEAQQHIGKLNIGWEG